MKCPFCGHIDTQVKDSRITDNGRVTRRRRLCNKCRIKFTTFERAQIGDLFIIKRSGLKKKFDRDKVIKSIMTATRKRKVSDNQINQIVDDISQEIEQSATKAISTHQIGEIIMKSLAQIDQVACIRFASVYKDFTSTADFARFINKMKDF